MPKDRCEKAPALQTVTVANRPPFDALSIFVDPESVRDALEGDGRLQIWTCFSEDKAAEARAAGWLEGD